MKKSCCFVFFIYLYIAGYAQQPTATSPKITVDSIVKAIQERNDRLIGKNFPLFSTVYKNQNFNNKNLAGKIVFVNFWFATCAPCLAEFGDLNQLYDSLKGNKNFEFISFTYEKQDKIDEIVKQYNMQYKILSISYNDCYRLNQNNGFPVSIIIDDKGKINYLRAGGFASEEFVTRSVFNLFYPKLKAALTASGF
ncbi:TlpA family protein disulfide reductase [Ferruginibacter sp.]